MKKVVINGRFLIHRVTGVERYAREVLAELDRIVQPGEMELAVPPEVSEIPAFRNIPVVRTGRLHNRLWEHVSFPLYVRKQGAVSLNLCNVAPLPAPGIVCIHDMKIQARPQDFSKGFLWWYQLLFRNQTKRAKLLLTVSEFSRREICRYSGTDPSRIEVVPDAWQHFKRIGFDEAALDKYGLEKGEYYFSLSSMEPNKNFKWIAEAAGKNPDRIFAVAGSVNAAVFADGLGFACPENMKLLGYVSDGEAKTLMRDCRAFLFPSFYEGFGMPPLEALSAGCPRVVVSDTEVMHEVFGDCAAYIDPAAPWDSGDSLSCPAAGDAARVLEKYSWAESAKILYGSLKKLH